MNTTSGLESETATAPTDELWTWPSVTGSQVAPPSTVFHSPPPVWPEYASFGRPFTPATASARPRAVGPDASPPKGLQHNGVNGGPASIGRKLRVCRAKLWRGKADQHEHEPWEETGEVGHALQHTI